MDRLSLQNFDTKGLEVRLNDPEFRQNGLEIAKNGQKD